MSRWLQLAAPSIAGAGTVIVHGHWGRPVLVFASESGRAEDFENNGMTAAVGQLLADGRVKLYCVDSYDAGSWSRPDLSTESRARQHERYERWIVDEVVPFIHADCAGPLDIVTTGCSMGAYHAANITLRRADLFPVALCLSGNYDPGSGLGWGERGDAAYFNTPVHYLAHVGGDHLDWLRRRVHLVLVCGQGQWEDTTGALASTRQLAALLADRQIPHELDLWGHDVPHDWPSWRRQLAHHLPRLC